MPSELETAQNPQKLERIVIEPLTRVEGHGKVTLLQDENHHIRQARLHITEFRGFEKFIQGRPYWELPVLVQRLCGICPVSHHLAAAKATDMIVGAPELTPTAEKIRRLMHFGQTLQSHAPVLIFTYGNPSRGDDALGLAMYDLLEKYKLETNKLENVDLLTDYQLQIEMQSIWNIARW